MTYDAQNLLRDAHERRASDLHIVVDSPPVYRVNGELKTFDDSPLTVFDTERIAKELIPSEQWNQFIETGELDFNYELEGISRYRMNAFYQRNQISAAIRLIPTKIPTIEELDLPPVIREMAEKHQGLVLVTGPTGSGKSSTLAAMIDYINRNYTKHIITLEDPIEFVHPHKKSIINQREIGFDTKNFTNGLRASLRQDPDVILVGEMRDLETISTAVTAAETGHLVFATLHTSSAAQTIDRIIDVFPPHQQQQIRLQLSNVLVGVISQRLLKTTDGRGRTAATEILINTPSIGNLIRNEKNHQIQNVLQTSRAQGMHTMAMSVQKLLQSNRISHQEAIPFMNLGDFE